MTRTVCYDAKYDKRQSGRTHRMVVAAFRRAYLGKSVYVVVANKQILNYVAPMLKELGAKIHGNTFSASVGEGPKKGTIYFLSRSNAEVCGLCVKGVAPEDVFFDHEYVHDSYEKVLAEYHKYDD